MRVEYRQKLLDIDLDYSQRLQIADKPGTLRNFAILAAHSGDSWFWLLGLTLLWWFGTYGWKLRASIMIAGILVTALIVMLIKFSVRRKRPSGEWGNIYRKTDPHSFPSGHAARAALLATLAVGLGPAWFAVILVVWAPLVIFARVAMGLHYLSDVLIGALLGVLIAILVLIIFPIIIIPQIAFLI
jgi:undecaprenyl-diphosphatase